MSGQVPRHFATPDMAIRPRYLALEVSGASLVSILDNAAASARDDNSKPPRSGLRRKGRRPWVDLAEGASVRRLREVDRHHFNAWLPAVPANRRNGGSGLAGSCVF
jgi:hypothetical protein